MIGIDMEFYCRLDLSNLTEKKVYYFRLATFKNRFQQLQSLLRITDNCIEQNINIYLAS